MDTTTRNTERAAGQGDPAARRAAAAHAVRRGDRLAAVVALAALALPGQSEAQVANMVRDELAALIPCPVGEWVTLADYRRALGGGVVLRPRAPRLTDAERRAITLARSA